MDIAEFIWDMSQQIAITQLDHKAESTEAGLEVAFKQIRELNARVFGLATTCQVLCDAMTEKFGYSQETLTTLLKQKLDDSIRSSEICPSCGHRFHPTRRSCLYCGFKPEHEPQ